MTPAPEADPVARAPCTGPSRAPSRLAGRAHYRAWPSTAESLLLPTLHMPFLGAWNQSFKQKVQPGSFWLA